MVKDLVVTMMQATGKLCKNMVIADAVKKLPGCVYDPKKFPGIRYKPVPGGSLTFLIFGKDKIVITGGKSLDELQKAGEFIAKRFGTTFSDLVLHCVTGTIDFERQVDLTKLAAINDDMQYNPETFPRVIFRPPQFKAKFLIFNSSRAVIAGARTVDEFHEAGEWFGKFLDEHKEALKA